MYGLLREEEAAECTCGGGLEVSPLLELIMDHRLLSNWAGVGIVASQAARMLHHIERTRDDAPPLQATGEPAVAARVVSRATARTILSLYTDSIRPKDVEIRRMSHGKPRVHSPGVALDDSIEFSVTHTRGMLGIAVARGVGVGLDAERLDRGTTRDVVKLARRRMSASEAETVAELERAHGKGDKWQPASADAHICAGTGLEARARSYVEAEKAGLNCPNCRRVWDLFPLDLGHHSAPG